MAYAAVTFLKFTEADKVSDKYASGLYTTFFNIGSRSTFDAMSKTKEIKIYNDWHYPDY